MNENIWFRIQCFIMYDDLLRNVVLSLFDFLSESKVFVDIC